MFSWIVQELPDGKKGATATAGPFHLVVTPATHPETKEFVGYAFKLLGMQGGGTNFMSCSPTMEEAQARAEFTYVSLILAGLCVVDQHMLDEYVKYVKTVSALSLEDAMVAAAALEKRNREIFEAASRKQEPQAEPKEA